MKLFPNLVKGVTESLQFIFEKNYQADKVLDYLFKGNPKWGARDRAFVAESVYDMVRSWRKLWAIYENEITFHEPKLMRLFAIYWLLKGNDLPPWEEFKGIDKKYIFDKAKQNFPRAIEFSLHDELDEIGYVELGEQWEKELAAMNQPANIVLRTNTLKTTKRELQKALQRDDILTLPVDEAHDALVLNERKNVFAHPLFKQGHFEVQDAGSQMIAQFLDIQPGMRVIDACAGAGGKALHIAALMENKGRIVAMDVEEKKLAEMRQRARRNGVSIIETKLIESSKTIKRLKDTADRLLMDVPCSGTGVMKRNPDAKYRIDKKFIERLLITQQDILQRYSQMLKQKGLMVYATCSLLPSENKMQVEKFLKANANFELIDEKTLYPSAFGFDGFYMARLRKN